MGCGLSKAHSNPEVLVSHANARLTVHGRLLIVQRHRAGMAQAHIASAMGVSRQCVKKWIDRFDQEGLAGLHDRSSRPHTMPTKTSDEVEQKVLAARAEHRDGPDVLGPKVGVPGICRTCSASCSVGTLRSTRSPSDRPSVAIRFPDPQASPVWQWWG